MAQPSSSEPDREPSPSAGRWLRRDLRRSAPRRRAAVLDPVAGPSLAVVLLLAVHLTLAVRSLVRENPTVDEVVHLPAGITYWQTGTFRLYHHNPPLVKLVAALPVARVGAGDEPLYRAPIWTTEPPNKAGVRARVRRLERRPLLRAVRPGPAARCRCSRSSAGWSSSPGRAGSTARAADCSAWRSGSSARTSWRTPGSSRPTWARPRSGSLATLPLLALPATARPGGGPRSRASCSGWPQLTKFSLILLYGLWPLLWLVRAGPDGPSGRMRRQRVARAARPGRA